MMEVTRGKITFSSGRTAYINAGLIGINADMDVCYGYDGGLVMDRSGIEANDYMPQPPNAAEAAELADYMIGLWTAYKQAALKDIP